MFGSHSPVRIVASLTVFTFSLLMAATASAQTPATAADKPVAELSAPVVKPAAPTRSCRRVGNETYQTSNCVAQS